jgi:deoxyribodipyrimidine photolyase
MSSISVIWFKRDLRLLDHLPLQKAIESGKPLLLLYIFEPSLIQDVHYSPRHWQFVWESLIDLQKRLSQIHPNAKLWVVREEVLPFFEEHFPPIPFIRFTLTKKQEFQKLLKEIKIFQIPKNTRYSLARISVQWCKKRTYAPRRLDEIVVCFYA